MIQYRYLGVTGLHVSEYCLGLLPIGPSQANKSEEEIIEVIDRALQYGVNFIDTAEAYMTQSILGKAIIGRRDNIVISTKSQALTYDDMARSFERSLKELDTNRIEIYHLHSGRAPENIFEIKKGAHQFLKEMKEQNVLNAIGISTHNVNTVMQAAQRDDIDIIFPLINIAGMGILGGTREEMLNAIACASSKGKGILGMKAFAGGNLLNNYYEALEWVRSIPEISAIAIGVINIEELEMNLKLFGVQEISDHAIFTPKLSKKIHIINRLCKGCGNCVSTCPDFALRLEDNKPILDTSKCVLCGYCSPVCPEFAIRLI